MNTKMSSVVNLANKIVTEIISNPDSLPSCVRSGIESLSTLTQLLETGSRDYNIVRQLFFVLVDLLTRKIENQKDSDSKELTALKSCIRTNVNFPYDGNVKMENRIIRCLNALHVQYDDITRRQHFGKLMEEVEKSTDLEALEYIDQFLLSEDGY